MSVERAQTPVEAAQRVGGDRGQHEAEHRPKIALRVGFGESGFELAIGRVDLLVAESPSESCESSWSICDRPDSETCAASLAGGARRHSSVVRELLAQAASTACRFCR